MLSSFPLSRPALLVCLNVPPVSFPSSLSGHLVASLLVFIFLTDFRLYILESTYIFLYVFN